MKNKWLIIIIAVLLVVITAMAVMLMKQNPSEESVSNGIVYEPNTGNDEKLQAGTDLPGIAIPGWTAIGLPGNSTEAEVSLHNPDANAGYYDLVFTLKLADTGEAIFTTGLVKPGYKCSKVTLNCELEKGEYSAVMLVQPYMQDTAQTPLNNAEMEILLIVE